MEIVVTGRHMQVSDRFRAHLDDKLAKVPQLAPRVQRVDVVVTHEPNKRQAKACERVEITCHVKGPVVRAEAVWTTSTPLSTWPWTSSWSACAAPTTSDGSTAVATLPESVAQATARACAALDGVSAAGSPRG